MYRKKRLFIYPFSKETYRKGSNNYIKNLKSYLSEKYDIINKPTEIGLLDPLFKIYKCDIIYFNWVEDLPHRQFGFLQIPLLFVLLIVSKIFKIKIIWFVHNNISHTKKYIFFKKFIIHLLKKFADVIITHSSELKLEVPVKNIYVFPHPIEGYQPLNTRQPYKYDILIWGSMSHYKGISEFVEFASASSILREFTILLAGRFNSPAYYEYICSKKAPNFIVINKILPEEELIGYFADSRYILFTYNSASVLSSASLSKTLSYGKEIIGPRRGAFKELGSEKLIYNYDSFSSLELLLDNLKNEEIKIFDSTRLVNYINNHTWEKFADFLYNTISLCFKSE